MPTVLVTGSSGFIGSRIANELVRAGHRVVGVDRRMVPHLRFEQIECDLLSMDLVGFLSSLAPEMVVHCAGNANVSVSVQNPSLDFESNTVVLHRLLNSIKASHLCPRFVFMSSAAVYGNPSALPIAEGTLSRPISPYGIHKKMCEDLCEYFARVEAIPAVVARIFSAYGAGLRKQLFWDLAAKIGKGGPVELFGTGNETRDFIHVNDVVRAVLLLLERGEPKVYNIASGEETTIRTAASLLITSMKGSVDRLRFNGMVKEGDPLYWRADVSSLQSLGFKTSMHMEAGLEDYAHWILAEENGDAHIQVKS